MWHHLEFNCAQLQTACGKSLQIIDTGEWNRYAGPDFLQAHLRIEGRDWHGSVEIHKEAGEWYQHGHHEDENYNNVILHVIYESSSKRTVKTLDGFQPCTLVLKPYISTELYHLVEAQQKQDVACAGNIEFISQNAFERQIERAHQEYLEYKIEELLEEYDPSLPLSAAWKNCLIAGVYKTLGIPANKTQMGSLAHIVTADGEIPDDVHSFIETVEAKAFKEENRIAWVQSGMRPASRPKNRIRQAAALHFTIVQTPFRVFFKQSPGQVWSHLIRKTDSAHLPGKSRQSLIKQIVYLPALYLLGDLLHSGKLQKKVFDSWREPGQHVPQEIKKPFKKAGFQINRSLQKIGLAHQYKRYCREGNCHRCEVFKKAIRS